MDRIIYFDNRFLAKGVGGKYPRAITRAIIIQVPITLNENFLVTAMLDYGTVFLLIFARQEPSTHLKENYTATISLTISQHLRKEGFLFIIVIKQFS